MSDFAFTKVTSNVEQDLRAMMVVLWDLGPKKPDMPKKPAAMKKPSDHKGDWKEGDPDFDLAAIEFNETLEAYKAARAQYQRELKDFGDWHKRYGGPFEIAMYSCDAHDALERDPKRYCISARTRGRGDLKNFGLPEGVKPGPAQDENMRRIKAGEEDLRVALARDPVFGQQELRP